MRWTQADLDRFNSKKLVNTVDNKKVVRKSVKAPQLGEMEFILKSLKVNYVCEHEFRPIHRPKTRGQKPYRFDFYLPDHKIAIEYEGIRPQKPIEGKIRVTGHTSAKGYTSNCEKYNYACMEQIRVLRYTTYEKNYLQLGRDLKVMLGK